MKTILVPVDFSPVTLSVLAAAEDLARGLGAHLYLIHVAAPEPDFIGLDVGPQHVRDWRAVQLREEHRDVQRMALELEERGTDVTPLLIQGPTVETILSQADKLDADMIILGSHGGSRLLDALVGSVSKGVLQRANRPVLIIPARRSGRT